MSLIDTHAHLDQPEFDDDRREVVERATAAGVESIVCVGITADSSEATVRLAEEHPEIYAAVGIQPNHTGDVADDEWDRIVALADHPRVIALGETGLDRYWDYAPFDVQRDYFDQHLRFSQERNLPILIHCREAEDDLLPMLRDAVARGPITGLIHSFSGDESMLAECVELGLYISLAGAVTYTNKKFRPLHEAAKQVPADRLVLETDSPYLTPTPLRGKQKRNEPANIVHTARRLAELRGVDVEELSTRTTENARRLFRLP